MTRFPTLSLTLAGAFSALLAFLAAGCCVLPMVLVAFGLGGAWLSLLDLPLAYRTDLQNISLMTLALAWTVFFWQRFVKRSDSPGSGSSGLRSLTFLLLGTGLVAASFLVWDHQGLLRRIIVEIKS